MSSPQDGSTKRSGTIEPPKGSAAMRHRLVTWLPSVCCLGTAALIGLTIVLPEWALDLYAPQYPEGPITLYAYAYMLEEQYEDIRGEIFELKLLNNLLGGRFPERPPELIVLPIVLGVVALLSASAAFVPRWANHIAEICAAAEEYIGKYTYGQPFLVSVNTHAGNIAQLVDLAGKMFLYMAATARSTPPWATPS